MLVKIERIPTFAVEFYASENYINIPFFSTV